MPAPPSSDVLDEYTALFAQIQDDYLKERLADIRDVIGRIQAQLVLQEGRHGLAIREPVIVVASEILPSQVIAFEQLPVVGIVTETGGTTGHAAILARSLGIPAATGFRGILQEVHTGDLLVLDGREGHVFVNPGPEVAGGLPHACSANTSSCATAWSATAIRSRSPPTVSASSCWPTSTARPTPPWPSRAGAGGVGLYRTEYLFLTHPSVPDEEEQLAAYRAVIEAAPNRTVTIRTLDIGGDKHVPYLGTPHQANPFLGWRSTRLSFAYPELFQTQLRAILRAGRHGRVSLLFP